MRQARHFAGSDRVSRKCAARFGHVDGAGCAAGERDGEDEDVIEALAAMTMTMTSCDERERVVR